MKRDACTDWAILCELLPYQNLRNLIINKGYKADRIEYLDF
jgi:hypothetical protein